MELIFTYGETALDHLCRADKKLSEAIERIGHMGTQGRLYLRRGG